MGRIRTIKPDFFRHEDLYELEVKTKLPIRVAYAGLFTVADREGRFKWKPSLIKLDILPFDEVNINEVLLALWLEGYIKKYEIGGKEFGFIPSWKDHQVIRNDEAKSVIPEPDSVFLLNPHEPVTNPLRIPIVEGKGKEGEKEKEKEDNMLDESSDQDKKKEDSAIIISDCSPNQISTASDNTLLNLSTDVEANGFEELKKNVAPEKFPFSEFWDLYDRKVGKQECVKRWAKLSDRDKEAIMIYVPLYVAATPDEQFRKHPDKFLNKKCWLDELPVTNKSKFYNNGAVNKTTSNTTRGTNPRGTSFFDNQGKSAS